jgi:site-specific recombinase XerD
MAMFRLRSRAAGHSDTTWQGYEWTLGSAIKYFGALGVERPADVRSAYVQQFLNDCRERGLSSSSVWTRYKNLRVLFRSLVADGLLEQNPTDRIPRPKVEKKIPPAFDGKSFMSVLERIDTRTGLGKRNAALLYLLLDSGARLSEVLGLRLGNVDLAKGIATVKGKGGRFRVIAWGSRTGKALLSWLQCRQDGQTGPDALLFIDKWGGPLSRHAVRLLLKRLTQAAGIARPRLGAHAMRHGCALALLRGGADLESTRRTLGHSKLTTTQVYLQGLSDEEALATARAVACR